MLLLRFPQFVLSILLVSGSHPGYHILFNHHVFRLDLIVTISQNVLMLLMTLTALKSTDQMLCRMLVMVRLCLWVFERQTTEVKYLFITSYKWHILSTRLITVDVEISHLAVAVFVRSFTVKIFFFIPTLQYSQKEITLFTSNLQCGVIRYIQEGGIFT